MNFGGLGYNTVLVLAGVALLGGAAGVIGCFSVLRRRGLLGDALAHAALPGVCLAYYVVGKRDFQVLLLGAFLSGLAGIATISALRHWTRIKEDAAMAIVLSVFFGLGIVLLGFITRLPGGYAAGLDHFILGKAASMQLSDLELISYLALGTLLAVLLLFKEFKLVTFDPAFAQVQGWPALALDLFLQLLLIVAVVVGLPAVGVVLMAALLVIPAAAARFWTERLGILLLLSAGFGMLAGIMGALPSAYLTRVPTGPLIILAAALLFLISLSLGSRRGLLVRWMRQRRYRRQMHSKQLLEALHPYRDGSTEEPALQEKLNWTRGKLRSWLRWGEKQGLLERQNGTIRLTELGKTAAAEVKEIKERWKALLLDHPRQIPSLLRLDLPAPESVLPHLTRETSVPSWAREDKA